MSIILIMSFPLAASGIDKAASLPMSISVRGGQDFGSDSYSNAREHSQVNKMREFENEDIVSSDASRSYEISAVTQKLEELHPQEREYLSNFFKYSFFVSAFGYTIFGDKPMSMETINIVEERKSIEGFDYMNMEHILYRYRLREGWEVWKKYSSLFPLEGYSLISYAQPINRDYIEIAIINHENFLKTVVTDLADFQKVLKENLTPEQVLNEYLKAEGPVFNTIRNHDGLFGTLLGYGRDNSWEFMRRLGGETLSAFSDVDPTDTSHILPPHFTVIEHSEETAKLRECYGRQQRLVDHIYQRDDFLECVLLKITNKKKEKSEENKLD